MAKAANRGGRLFTSLTVVVIIVGGLLWMSGLTNDPPEFFNDVGQSLGTDPAHCVYHARNQVLFNDVDPFDFSRWIVISRSVTSMTAYLWFSIAGVSLEQANMVGVLLTLAALLLFLIAVSHLRKPWVTAAVAICYLINITMIVHGRLSFLENGLLFITSILFVVYSRWGDKRWGLYTSAVLVAAAALMGKLFGILLLPAFLLSVWISAGPGGARKVGAAGVAFAIGFAVIFIALFSTSLPDAVQYYTEGTYSLHGFPAGLKSPWAFVEHLISYGDANSLFHYSPDLLVFLWFGGFLLTYLIITGHRFNQMPRVTILATLAVPCVLVGLSPLNYSPLRYGLLLIPPLIIFFFATLDYLSANSKPGQRKTGYKAYIFFLAVTWQMLFHVTGMVMPPETFSSRAMVWAILPIALAITWIFRRFLTGGKFKPGKRSLYVLAWVALIFAVSINGYRIVTYMWGSNQTTIKRANADLSTILGPDAVVAGPYAPMLTLDTVLKSFIYYFGVTEADPNLFRSFPITHLAVDYYNWKEVVKTYPVLENELPITIYNIRNYEVMIYDIAEKSGNEQAGRYQKTSYERAKTNQNRQEYQQAYAELAPFVRSHPTCWSANILQAELLLHARQFDQAAVVLTTLSIRHSEDYYTNLTCGRAFQVMAFHTKNSMYETLSEKYYKKAAQDDPIKTENVRHVYETTMQELNAGSN